MLPPPVHPPACPRQLNVIVYQGCVRSREVLRKYEWSSLGTSVMLVTYEILHADCAELLKRKINWKLLVADEAHTKYAVLWCLCASCVPLRVPKGCVLGVWV